MAVLGIDEITFGVEDLATCGRFYDDWGLQRVSEARDQIVFETLNGCRVVLADIDKPGLPPAIESGSTLREVVWGCASIEDLALYRSRIAQDPGFFDAGESIGCIDPNGLALRLQVSRKHEIQIDCASHNTWISRGRVNTPAPIYDRARPIEVGHIVLFVSDVEKAERFYADRFGFHTSDRYPRRGAFMRSAAEGGHHDLFMLQLPDRPAGLNHVAFTVRDIHEVFGGGMHISRCGWSTQLGPGRHPVSSAFFWYFHSPAGALVEYYADEDELTEQWEPREFEPGPTVFAEWAIAGGLDGNTRRQVNAGAPQGKFLTDKADPPKR